MAVVFGNLNVCSIMLYCDIDWEALADGAEQRRVQPRCHHPSPGSLASNLKSRLIDICQMTQQLPVHHMSQVKRFTMTDVARGRRMEL